MVHIYNGILLNHKKEWNNSVCSGMDGPRDYHTKWSQTEKDKYHMILTSEILKKNTNELIYKTETLTEIDDKFMVTNGDSGGLGVWD